MKECPLVILHLKSLDVELMGSVHTLDSNVPLILGEIERFSPDFVAVELTDPGRMTGSMDVDAVREQFHSRIVPIDRSPEITASRYLCDTPPARYLREALIRFIWLPFNEISILSFNYLDGLYRRILGDSFYTFGWSEEDARRYIFERDEYMAARLIEHMRARRDQGYRDRYAVIVGRRHVAGMAAILDAYAVTGDVGSYYAGGKVYEVFSLNRLNRAYDVSREEATRNLSTNRLIEALARTFYLPAYMLIFFGGAFVVALIVTLIVSFFLSLITGRWTG